MAGILGAILKSSQIGESSFELVLLKVNLNLTGLKIKLARLKALNLCRVRYPGGSGAGGKDPGKLELQIVKTHLSNVRTKET